jgi:AcrR family transcriptional regulator
MDKTVGSKVNKRSEQQRAQETKAKILSAALSEFSKSGFDGVSTRAIATKAGVNHTLISHHFGSKDVLWKATAESFFDTYNQEFLKRRNATDGVDTEDLLRIYIRSFIEFCVKCPDFQRFMIQANQGDEERLNWIIDRFLRPSSDSEELGFFLQSDSLHMRYLFLGAATSIFTFAPEFSRLSGKDPFSPEMVEQHIDYLLKIFSSQTKEHC